MEKKQILTPMLKAYCEEIRWRKNLSVSPSVANRRLAKGFSSLGSSQSYHCTTESGMSSPGTLQSLEKADGSQNTKVAPAKAQAIASTNLIHFALKFCFQYSARLLLM